MSLGEFHARIGIAALIFMIISGVWGLLRWRRKQGVDSNYFGVLVVGELLLIGQALFGAYLWLALGLTPASDRPWMHFLYGFVAALTLPAVFAFTRGQTDEPRYQAMYAFACLFIMGLIIRAMTTAGYF